MTLPAPAILVIDDSYAVRQLTVNVLRKHGYTVLEAEDGQQGLALALEERPDVVLCDIHMPGLDGWGFMTAARASDALATTPVLMISSVNNRESVRRAMAAGADDYLTKPWTQVELLSAVASLHEKSARIRAESDREIAQLRGAVMATIPHELRTPMVTILGASELLMTRRERYSEARVQQMLEDIHRNAKALTRTISRMMDWAELNAHSDTSAHLSPAVTLDVESVVSDVLRSPAFATEVCSVLKTPDLDLAARCYGSHPVQVRLEPGRVRCMAPDFHTILTELLTNALRFSKPGRPVGITGKQLGTTGYQLEIANMGVAMPAQFIAQIGALAQANREQLEQQGMGLGLAIGQLTARRNGASLQVTRFDGMPTVVRLTFPGLE